MDTTRNRNSMMGKDREGQQTSVAFVINSLEGGGAEKVIVKALSILEPYFAGQNWTVYLILLDDVEQLQRCPSYVKLQVLTSQGSLLKGYRQLADQLRKINPLLCFSFLTRANLLNAWLCKTLRYRAILSERVNTSSHLSSGLKDAISRQLVRMFYPNAQRVVAVSRGVKQDLVDNFALSQVPVDIVYNPFDCDALFELAQQRVDDLPQQPYMIGIGRLTRNKNFAMLLRAYALAQPSEHLVILGKGEEHERLTELARQLGIEEKVHFLGYKQNPYPYLLNAVLFVSTSNAEGFPNAIVEAMCLGLPVLATNCESGPAEILADVFPLQAGEFRLCKYGGLSPVEDVAAFSAGLRHFSNPELRREYGVKSRQRAADFSYPVFRTRLIDVVNNALKESSPAHV